MLVSLVGVGLLIREASLRGFVTLTIEMRLIAVAIFGFGLLGLGWRQRARQPVYGLSLQGGGIAVLYLTTFAAYARYDLLPAVAALVAVVAITVGAGALAVVQRSLSLALLGLIGGYLAPLLAYRWPEDHLAVFSFYAVLSVAVISVARMRSWPALTLAGYVFTFAVSALWLANLPAGDDWVSLQPFVAVFVLLYMAVPVISGARPSLDVRSLWIVPLVFGTPFIGIALQSMLVGHTEHGLLISALVLAAAHAVLHVIVRRWGDDGRMLTESYAALAVAFVAMAVPLAFDAYAWATAWVLQGVLLVWLGTRWGRLTPVVGGIGLQLSAAAVYAYFLASDGVADVLTADPLQFWMDATPILNQYFLGALLFAICGLISAWRLLRGSRAMRIEPAAPWAALAWGGGWWFFAAFAEAYVRLDDARLPVMSLIAILTFGGNRGRCPRDAMARIGCSGPVDAAGSRHLAGARNCRRGTSGLRVRLGGVADRFGRVRRVRSCIRRRMARLRNGLALRRLLGCRGSRRRGDLLADRSRRGRGVAAQRSLGCRVAHGDGNSGRSPRRGLAIATTLAPVSHELCRAGARIRGAGGVGRGRRLPWQSRAVAVSAVAQSRRADCGRNSTCCVVVA